jgi:hypothetical protein
MPEKDITLEENQTKEDDLEDGLDNDVTKHKSS